MIVRLVASLAIVALAAPSVSVAAPSHSVADSSRTITVAIGGDILLGGRMNALEPRYGAASVLADGVPELRDADIAIANLESVVATAGRQGVDKGQVSPLYFRGRPETLAVLSEAGIDAVTTANNHAGDYGPEALLESHELLSAMGIVPAGSGPSADAACRPAIVAARGVRIALFSVDTTQSRYAATSAGAGTCYVPLADRGAWQRTFEAAVIRAHQSAHAVIFYVHWGPSFATTPNHDVRTAAQWIVELGADAVIGSNAHRIQGIETVDGRPVIYDLGSLLFDFPDPHDSVVWQLTVGAGGVEKAVAVPLVSETGRTRHATGAERIRILEKLSQLSAQSGSDLRDGTAVFEPPGGPSAPLGPSDAMPPVGTPPAPLAAPPPGCTVAGLPTDATALDVPIGPFRLIGVRLDPATLPEPAMLWVESFWTVDDVPTGDYWLAPRAYPAGTGLAPWGDPHQPCDWQWPADRWKPGSIYRDRYPVRPADSILRLGGAPALLSCGFCGPLEIRIGVERDGHLIGESGVIGSVPLGPQLLLRTGLVALGAGLIAGPALAWWVIKRRARAVGRRADSDPG